VIKGLPISVMYYIQYTTEILVFLFCGYVIYEHDWPYSHGVFICFQASIHFMKIHSYNATNVLFREEYLHLKEADKIPSSNYPHNVNFKDFLYFLLAPTFVYWYHYPRTPKIRWNVLTVRVVCMIFGLLSVYLMLSEYVYPIIQMGKNITHMQAIAFLSVPLFITFIIVFFTVFECILNIYGELWWFADRDFYGDWWNCVNYEEYCRKWNKIVHEFLFRHFYAEAIHRLNCTRWWAYLLTMTFTSFLHQLIASIVLKKIFFFYFVMVMGQVPASIFLDTFFKGYSFYFRNAIFWVGLMIANTCGFVHFMQDYFA